MRRTSMVGRITLICLVGWLGCAPDEPGVDDEVESTQQSLVPEHNPVLEITASGHGKVFGRNLVELELDLPRIVAWQEAMRADLASVTHGRLSHETELLLRTGDALIRSERYVASERALLRGALIWRMLQDAPRVFVDAFEWRNEVLNSHIFGRRAVPQISLEIIQFLGRIGYTSWERRWGLRWGSYAEQCRRALVPIPPNWAESGTPWVYQGALTFNILSPGGAAHVYTYRDWFVRGGCVALPRGSGAPGDVAGIICQSAVTGRACFWDNILTSQIPEFPLGWKDLTLVIGRLKNGSNLDSACTTCHRGNNVFLMTPDDPVWAKLMRDGLTGGTGLFTTRVLGSSDFRDGHPRYIPLSGIPPRDGWENTYVAPGCAGDCHETPAVSPIAGTMPPACGTACVTF